MTGPSREILPSTAIRLIRRIPPIRDIPFIGNNLPFSDFYGWLENKYKKLKEQGQSDGQQTYKDLLELLREPQIKFCLLLDLYLSEVGKGSRKIRNRFAEEFVRASFASGEVSPQNLKKKKNNLAPLLLDDVVREMVGGELDPGSFPPSAFFEQGGRTGHTRAKIIKATMATWALSGLATLIGGVYLRSLPLVEEQLKDLSNFPSKTDIFAASVAGLTLGALGSLIFNEKRKKIFTAAAFGALGAILAFATLWQNAYETAQTITFYRDLYQERFPWVVIGSFLFGTALSIAQISRILKRARRMQEFIDENKEEWSLFFELLFAQIEIVKSVQQLSISPQKRSRKPINFSINDSIRTIVDNFNYKDPKTSRIKLPSPWPYNLAHFIFDAETYGMGQIWWRKNHPSFRSRKPPKQYPSGDPQKRDPLVTLLPHPADVFLDFDKLHQNLGELAWDRFKSLRKWGDKKELSALAALMFVFPTLPLVLQCNTFFQPSAEKTQYHGETGNQWHSCGVSVEILRRWKDTMTIRRNSHWQSNIIDHLNQLKIPHEINPIGNLWNKTATPPYLRMAMLYSCVLKAGRPTTYTADGTSGFIEEITQSIIDASKINPLIPHLALADLRLAIDKAPHVLTSLEPDELKSVINTLKTVVTRIIDHILRELIPQSRSEIQAVLTDQNPWNNLSKLSTTLQLIFSFDINNDFSNSALKTIDGNSLLRASGLWMEGYHYPTSLIDALKFAQEFQSKISQNDERINQIIQTLASLVLGMVEEAFYFCNFSSSDFNPERAEWTTNFCHFAFEALPPPYLEKALALLLGTLKSMANQLRGLQRPAITPPDERRIRTIIRITSDILASPTYPNIESPYLDPLKKELADTLDNLVSLTEATPPAVILLHNKRQ